MKLTDAALRALTLPAGPDLIVFDDDIPGFAVRLRASGARTWIFQYSAGGKQPRLTIGKVSAMTAAVATARW